jgi:hypothetical protein
MRGIFASLLILSVIAFGVQYAAADMVVKLKNGQVITLPVSPQDIDSVTFTAPHAAHAAAAPATPAPAAASTAMAAPTPAPMPAPSPVPALASASPAIPGAAAIPSQTLAMSPLAPSHPSGRVLHVGPGQDLKLPSQAAQAAQDGDVIEIDAGDYRGDVAVWKANDLVIRGVNGRPHLDADGSAAQGKAIWVTAGKDIRIENVEMSGCHVGDGNGAAIRAEGAGLVLSKVYIHDNEDGILTTDNGDSDVVIENSEFAHNGTTSGSTHGVYIGHVRSFTLRGSYFHDTETGHHVKTRALANYILYNRILDGPNGDASYSIDMSNGGRSYVIGNIIEKGPKAENFTLIAYAMEGPTNPVQELYVVGNTMIIDRSNGIFIRSRGPNPAFVADNVFAGPGELMTGSAKFVNNVLGNNAHADTDPNSGGGQGNRTVADLRFADPTRYDYHLLPGSAAIGAGADPGDGAGFKLMPVYEPLTPLGFATRPVGGALDAGALSFVVKG